MNERDMLIPFRHSKMEVSWYLQQHLDDMLVHDAEGETVDHDVVHGGDDALQG